MIGRILMEVYAKPLSPHGVNLAPSHEMAIRSWCSQVVLE